MKKLVILGAGTGGTMMANKLRKVLDRSAWEMIIVDEEKNHYYQPGFIFIPFGIYTKQDVIKPKADFIPSGVKLVFGKIDRIENCYSRKSCNEDAWRVTVSNITWYITWC
jgi:sulfide:quinone oxidoreductase